METVGDEGDGVPGVGCMADPQRRSRCGLLGWAAVRDLRMPPVSTQLRKITRLIKPGFSQPDQAWVFSTV